MLTLYGGVDLAVPPTFKGTFSLVEATDDKILYKNVHNGSFFYMIDRANIDSSDRHRGWRVITTFSTS